MRTCREYDGALVIAKRLECGELPPAFCFASEPPEVRKGKIDSEFEFEGMNEQISFICYVRKMSKLQGRAPRVPLALPQSWVISGHSAANRYTPVSSRAAEREVSRSSGSRM